MKWFTFRQNNSGGYFEEDDNVCEIVSIQAETANDAVRFAKRIMNNDNYCECCGERWYFYMDEDDGYDVPSLYGEPLIGSKRAAFRRKAILHYADGKRQIVELKK